MKFKFFFWLLLVFFTAFILYSVESVLIQRSISEKTLRLHIVANSNCTEDQMQKLRVRDHVLKELELLTRNCNSLEEVESTLLSNLEALRTSAQRFLLSEGCDRAVCITLCKESFPTRYYDTFRLPAGDYHSLRVQIGNADGKNWWCVVFPSLCNAATEDALQSYGQFGGYNEGECRFIKKSEPRYELRFKFLEWFKMLRFD
ncbi:MAG: stage II sporulation protein R [Oscillospiraceae bacterium]|nr:stage II sporulation protein R [Oscillospiraceae bacterium]